MEITGKPLHVSLVALPETVASSLYGVYDALWFVGVKWDERQYCGTQQARFIPEIVSTSCSTFRVFNNLTITPHRTLSSVSHTDIVYLPSIFIENGTTLKHRHPEVLEWVRDMYTNGALVCSACAGSLVIAEAGLLDGLIATTHWAFTQQYHQDYPKVKLKPERVLVSTGDQQRIVTAGGASSWSDLVLYLVQRFASADEARLLAKALLLQWHSNGQTAYASLMHNTQHTDKLIADAQVWLAQHYADSDALSRAIERSGVPDKTFKRRFKQATGYAPLRYIQNLRVEEAKQMLEQGQHAIDLVASEVGYDDIVFFRKLFKRLTGITPGEYRKAFCVPEGR